ncbi:unnamed protein product, partial [Rotaria magnacalcarata]
MKRLHNPDVEPLRLFITGGAGTGKSHLLKCLHYEATRIFSRKKQLDPDENINEIHTLITAFTGAAAVNVGGLTIHSAFGIGTQFQSLNNQLSCDKLNSYRCKLQSLKLLFVDEVSLIQANLWGAMHSRLTQIMGVHSNTIIFGNIAIIAIGDFYQCSPVACSSIYSSLLWSDHFEYVELKINERQKTNFLFSQMLNRIRKLKKKEDIKKEDHDLLEQCHQNYLKKEYHREALHIFAKNAQVDAHNEEMIEKCFGRIHRINCRYCHEEESVCVTRESDTTDQQESDLRSKKIMKQFPLRLSWAMTIHKAQGITVDQVIISTKDMFGTGMGYTALSRVRTLEGLFLIDLHPNKFYCNENVDKILSQMKNIRLRCNFNAFKNHYATHKADIICLTETWL